MNKDGEVVTDSAGVTCRYTRADKIEVGDVIIHGWRATVTKRELRRAPTWSSENDAGEVQLSFDHGGFSPWISSGTLIPVEITERAYVPERLVLGGALYQRIEWPADERSALPWAHVDLAGR